MKMNTYDLFLHYTEAETRTHSTILLFEGEKEGMSGTDRERYKYTLIGHLALCGACFP